jgi:hypothetical protein
MPPDHEQITQTTITSKEHLTCLPEELNPHGLPIHLVPTTDGGHPGGSGVTVQSVPRKRNLALQPQRDPRRDVY